jgi:hypothetical protein
MIETAIHVLEALFIAGTVWLLYKFFKENNDE